MEQDLDHFVVARGVRVSVDVPRVLRAVGCDASALAAPSLRCALSARAVEGANRRARV